VTVTDVSSIRSAVLAFEQRRYVVVFTDPKRKPARLVKPSGSVDYDGGEFDGMLRVFDSEGGKLLCQAPVKAESSDSVKYFDQGLLAENPQEAVSDNFGAQLTTAGRECCARSLRGSRSSCRQ